MSPEHEHLFYAHEDPRWLICDCGQYATRIRTAHGQAAVRLIDPPRPIFTSHLTSDLCTDVRTRDVRPVEVRSATPVDPCVPAPAIPRPDTGPDATVEERSLTLVRLPA
jgi:hypothetical protein